jgi:hypothetical protein
METSYIVVTVPGFTRSPPDASVTGFGFMPSDNQFSVPYERH